MDCAEIHEMEESAKNGIHFIWPRNRIVTGPVSVYCDMEDDGGAWTVRITYFCARLPGSVFGKRIISIVHYKSSLFSSFYNIIIQIKI